MDYSGILKRAWSITWKYKILWLFGLFAGAGSGGGSGGGGSNSSSGFNPGSSGSSTANNPFSSIDSAAMQRALPIIIGIVALLVLFGIAWFVLSFAARGGLLHLVNEVEEGRPIRAGDGWRVGFSRWGRVFGVYFLIALPILVLLAIGAVVIGFAIAGSAAAGSLGREGTAAGVLSALSGLCCFGGVFFIALIVLGAVLAIVAELAVRYAVLKDMRVIESLKAGWADLRAKRGSVVMYLIMVGVGIAYSIVVAIVAVVLIAPAVVAGIAGAWPVAGLLGLIALPILMIPAAIFGAFSSAAWTIFFRRMTGMEAVPVRSDVPSGGFSAGYPPPPPSGLGAPSYPPPPQAPAPPAPQP